MGMSFPRRDQEGEDIRCSWGFKPFSEYLRSWRGSTFVSIRLFDFLLINILWAENGYDTCRKQGECGGGEGELLLWSLSVQFPSHQMFFSMMISRVRFDLRGVEICWLTEYRYDNLSLFEQTQAQPPTYTTKHNRAQFNTTATKHKQAPVPVLLTSLCLPPLSLFLIQPFPKKLNYPNRQLPSFTQFILLVKRETEQTNPWRSGAQRPQDPTPTPFFLLLPILREWGETWRSNSRGETC